jgi:hypothetical protein
MNHGNSQLALEHTLAIHRTEVGNIGFNTFIKDPNTRVEPPASSFDH